MILEYMDEENLRLQYSKYSDLFFNLQKEVLDFTQSLASLHGEAISNFIHFMDCPCCMWLEKIHPKLVPPVFENKNGLYEVLNMVYTRNIGKPY